MYLLMKAIRFNMFSLQKYVTILILKGLFALRPLRFRLNLPIILHGFISEQWIHRYIIFILRWSFGSY